MSAFKEIHTIDEFTMLRVEDCASDIRGIIYEWEFMVWIQSQKMTVINN